MNFDSLLFFVFLVLVLAAHAAVRGARGRTIVLLGASYTFYGFWNPPFVLLLAFSTAVDWFCARGIERARRYGSASPAWLLGSLVTNLGLLAYFKYSGFVLANLSDGLGALGVDWQAPGWQLVLPVGISFYTFQSISYTIDVWRGERKPERDPLDFALYVSFFAQLVAGPIVRAGEMLPQLKQRTGAPLSQWPLAWWLIVFGLFMKVVLADSVFAPMSDRAFEQAATGGFANGWVAALAFAGQIYCDFCGYSTIAVGVAALFGLRLPDNFRSPYVALGFTDFWRRWHITLSRWLRDYLYIPLGGNRGSRARTLRNLAITMLLGGLWHGAAWTFVLWGALHGAYLVIERLLRRSRWPWIPGWPGRWVGGSLTLLAVLFAWVPFRATSTDEAFAIWRTMLWPDGASTATDATLGLALAGFGLLLAGQRMLAHTDLRSWWSGRHPLWLVLSGGVLLAAVLLSPSPGRPFIYFQF